MTRLIDRATGRRLVPGDIVTDLRGDRYKIAGLLPRDGSTGLVAVVAPDAPITDPAAPIDPGTFGAKFVASL